MTSAGPGPGMRMCVRFPGLPGAVGFRPERRPTSGRGVVIQGDAPPDDPSRDGVNADVDRLHMARALELAARGRDHVAPNPMVGAVVTRDGRLIAEGHHAVFGGPHAEVAAFATVGDPSELSGASLYVTLEPCSHHGKTPPCVDAILAAGVTRVVVAVLDPDPRVSGRGVERLRERGVKVEVGLLADEARALNQRFFTFHEDQRPTVIMKVATTLDGRIATADGGSRWITGPAAREEVHRLRSTVDAVVVGRRTVEADDPRLTVRHVDGSNPTRVILDSQGTLGMHHGVFRDGRARTIQVTLPGMPRVDEAWEIAPGEGNRPDLAAFLTRAAAEGWRSLLVEGGAGVFTAFLRSGLVDELHLHVSPRVVGADGNLAWAGELGVSTLALARAFRYVDVRRAGDDLLCTLERPPSPAAMADATGGEAVGACSPE